MARIRACGRVGGQPNKIKEGKEKKNQKRRVLDSGRRAKLHRHCQQSSKVPEPRLNLPSLVSLEALQGLKEAWDKMLWGFNPDLPFTFHLIFFSPKPRGHVWHQSEPTNIFRFYFFPFFIHPKAFSSII